MAHEKDQNFITEITNVNHERLIGDETHLNQILINLLSNAVKYTQEGGTVCLRFIGLAQHSNQFERIRIEVEDNGYGMSPEFLETIFDSFTRAENSTTNKVQGTGLGMSITKSLVELMGGTIEVESEEGKGTLFRVDLELRIPEEQAQGFFWVQQGIDRILAISYSERGRDAAVHLMEGTGVVVDTAADMHEAVALVQEAGNENGYQLLMYKPGKLDQGAIDEAESLRAIINPLDGPAVPVLYVLDNSFDRDEQVELPLRSGVLVHPFFLSTLKQAIEDVSGVSNAEAADHDKVLEGKHFLAAEDNLMNASILEELLDMEGATVEIVENGQLCVERFEACEPGEFDAILMDVQMPIMNGHDASRAIRSLSRPDAKTIPIFAMTADAFVEDEKAALAAGMNAHVAKPIEVSELKRAVDQFVEKGLS